MSLGLNTCLGLKYILYLSRVVLWIEISPQVANELTFLSSELMGGTSFLIYLCVLQNPFYNSTNICRICRGNQLPLVETKRLTIRAQS